MPHNQRVSRGTVTRQPGENVVGRVSSVDSGSCCNCRGLPWRKPAPVERVRLIPCLAEGAARLLSSCLLSAAPPRWNRRPEPFSLCGRRAEKSRCTVWLVVDRDRGESLDCLNGAEFVTDLQLHRERLACERVCANVLASMFCQRRLRSDCSSGGPWIVDTACERERLFEAGACFRKCTTCGGKLAAGAKRGGDVGVG